MNSDSSNDSFYLQSGWKDFDFVVGEFYYVVLAVLIIVVNSCVILAVCRKRFLRKSENYLLVSLAFSDLSTGLFGLPLVLLCSMAPSDSCILCYTAYAFTKLLSISTILHLVGVALERYVLIVLPFYHQRLRAKDVGVKVVLVSLWSVSLAVAAMPFTWLKNNSCLLPDDGKIWLIYTATCLVVFFVLPTFLLVYVFTCIFVVARDQIRKQETLMIRGPDEEVRNHSSTTKEARVAVIFVVMWLVFVVCWSPYFVLNLMDELEVAVELPDWLYTGTMLLRFLTSFLNPLLYSFLKQDFHQAFQLDRALNIVRYRRCSRPCNRRSAGDQEAACIQEGEVTERLFHLDTPRQEVITQDSLV